MVGRPIIVKGENGKTLMTINGSRDKRALLRGEYYIVGVLDNSVPVVKYTNRIIGLPKYDPADCYIVSMRVANVMCSDPQYKLYRPRLFIPNLTRTQLGKIESETDGWFVVKSLLKPCGGESGG